MSIAEDLMRHFAKNTGLSSARPPKRYLWTDAFAVCNLIYLAKQTQKEEYKQMAIDLVDQVHHTLGKHREDDSREGWLATESRPTKNGLRIGKRLPERKPDDPYNQRLEWERDGQYFHYLTKWMVALIKMAMFLEEEKYKLWAVDLLEASRSFIHNGRMSWKMSIDLSRPLIPSMGQHDPLDGYCSFKFVDLYTEEDLFAEVQEMYSLAQSISLPTRDPLGIGNLLVDAYRLFKMKNDRNFTKKIVNAAQSGLEFFNVSTHSLAFRELGLAIGLAAAKKLEKLKEYWPLKQKLIDYWLNHRGWSEHKDINQVMLVTSIIPEEFLKVDY
ncbi:MAG: hypothetical protein ACOC44_11565 [Promethearchaeia archaeon]